MVMPVYKGTGQQLKRMFSFQIKAAIAANQPVIYDATNAQRSWRMSLLMQINSQSSLSTSHVPIWMAWHLVTPLEICKAWNQKRDRQVPDAVIESMFCSLRNFPPIPAEGFAVVRG